MASDPLEIVIWDVTHGSAAFVKTPNGRFILFDAGSSDDFSPALYLRNKYGISITDLLIVSHLHEDHICDIENVHKHLTPVTLKRNKNVPLNVNYPGFPNISGSLDYYYKFFDRTYTAELAPDSSYRFDPLENWGNVKIRVFENSYPEFDSTNINNYSTVAVLVFGNLEIMFPGDLEAPGWQALMSNQAFVNIATPNPTNPNEIRFLVAPHHGRHAGVYRPFLDLYKPHLTVISDGYGVAYTDYNTYYQVTSGFSVYDHEKQMAETRYVVSTKVNDYVLISTDGINISVIV